MLFVSYKDRKQIAAALKPIYTAVNADAAWDELTLFAASPRRASVCLSARYGLVPQHL